MDTPIVDFVQRYTGENPVRLHMPGHKGKPAAGPENADITEIEGADELYASAGIIRRSEENAAKLFGTARTLYSAEGSSLCIRAMLYLARIRAAEKGLPFRVLAGRNVHKTMMTAAALLDLAVDWVLPGPGESLLSCRVAPEEAEKRLREKQYMAVYVTSPDYLGQMADIRGLAAVCRQYRVPLLVDNAHGAYLKFLPQDRHPITLGADLCCDSAHKTLPCLTGAAYLHIAENAPEAWREEAEQAMAMFASTSPSWLILQSLDRVNPCLVGGYPERIAEACRRTARVRERLKDRGWETAGDEPMKLAIRARSGGYTGRDLAVKLREAGIECEFSDPDFTVLMPSAETGEEDWQRLETALQEIPVLNGDGTALEDWPEMLRPEQVLNIREAMLAPRERISVEQAEGRILADAGFGCPPAVPPVMAGERISREAIRCLQYYGIDRLYSVKS